ncbi:Short-chain dehydrogenase/reductase SDR [Fusarium oxysporum f. sp. vasinfectum]|nr:Short-chain dehydrogenase/reductase SDR [Fusarium oxysporum f. sp. vasinfectum]
MTRSLQGSVVLVTAGTSGLGLCVAEKLIQAGASVVINYASNEERAHDAFVHLNQLAAKSFSQDTGSRCLKIKADVTKKEGIQDLVNQTVSAMGRIDAVVSNAGWTKFANFHDIDDNVDEEVWDRCYAANVKSHMFLCHAAKKYLEEAKGAFVMTASVAGVKPSGELYPAQIHLSKTLATVMAPSIRVNSVSPGFMETNWIVNMPQSKIDDAREKTLLKQITKVEDVAEQIILLIKSESVTGSNVVIDSGFSI